MMIDDSQKGFFTNVASVGLIKLGWLNLWASNCCVNICMGKSTGTAPRV
jgi:hypothetical protein